MREIQIIFVLAILLAFPVQAQMFSGGFSTRGGGGQETTRWTIVDYLAQKRSVQLMDQWLAVNRSKELFQFSFGGGPLTYDYKTTTGTASTTVSKTSLSYKAALYVSIFGLEGEYEKTNHDLTSYGGAFAIRLLGTSSQDTHLTAKYGIRTQIDESSSPHEKWSNQFAEGSLQIYLVKMFGLHGDYRHYFPDESSSGVDLQGHRTTAGVFFDIGLVRIYGDYFREALKYDNGATVTEKARDGYEYGARFYF